MAKKVGKGPQFLDYCEPILAVLRERGGSGTASEVTEAVVERLKVPPEEQKRLLKNGTSQINNRIAWARFYLAKAGLVESSKRGIWSLTEAGQSATFTQDDVYKLFQSVHGQFQKQRPLVKPATDRGERVDETIDVPEEQAGYRQRLFDILYSLPASGFEKLCQRLLREAGFEQVIVTGRSGDGGIDGHGILRLNPFVTFTVLFQCKRYRGAVTPSQVRDFRGAMTGRADKGIILTTGTFTSEAMKEARRDGAPPIELVDREKLVEMFETLQLGLKPRQTFEADEIFFEPFKEKLS